MSADESLPIGTVTPEQIAQAKAAAAKVSDFPPWRWPVFWAGVVLHLLGYGASLLDHRLAFLLLVAPGLLLLVATRTPIVRRIERWRHRRVTTIT